MYGISLRLPPLRIRKTNKPVGIAEGNRKHSKNKPSKLRPFAMLKN